MYVCIYVCSRKKVSSSLDLVFIVSSREQNEEKVYLVYLRWFEWIFQRKNLPSLSTTYVVINKVLEKWPPQLYKIEMSNDYDQCYVDVGVGITFSWRHYPNNLQPYFLALAFFPQNRSREHIPPTAASMFVKFEENLSERYRNAISPQSSFILYEFEKIIWIAFADHRKRDLISMNWGTLVGLSVNILVYFNKWANNMETNR